MVTGGSIPARHLEMIWVALGASVGLAGLWLRPVSVDEAWSLVVARRMNRGDRLYRDVFYGAGPLAIWLQSLAFRVLRPQGLVTRGLTAGYVVAELTAAAMLVGSGPVAAMAVVGIMVGCGGLHLGVHNQYGHLTMTAILWSAVALAAGRPALAGLLVGLGILGRYPVGLLAALSFGTVAAWGGGWSAGFALIAASITPVVVAALFRPSAIPWFFRRAVANKTAYLATAGFNPIRWIRPKAWRSWREVAPHSATVLAFVLVGVAPVIALLGLVSDPDTTHAISLALGLLGLSVVYPRFDGVHATAAVALSSSSLVLALTAGPALVSIGVAGWVLAIAGLGAHVDLTKAPRFRRDLPSLRHLPVRRLHGGAWPDQTEGLPSQVFLLRMDAPMVYACGGVGNPTPFDYPAASTFGPDGQAAVLEKFRYGRLALCDGWHDRADPLTPRQLVDGVSDQVGELTALGRLVSCADCSEEASEHRSIE